MTAEKREFFKLANMVTEQKHRAPRAEECCNHHLGVLSENQSKHEEHKRNDKTSCCPAARIGGIAVHEKTVVSKNVSTVTDGDGIAYYVKESIQNSRDKSKHHAYYPCRNINFCRKQRCKIMSADYEANDEKEAELTTKQNKTQHSQDIIQVYE